MTWSATPTIPSRTPGRGWFGSLPAPAVREPQLYWRQLVEAVWSTTLPALSAALLGEHRQSGSLEVALRGAVASLAAEHQQVGALAGGLHRLVMLATDITMGELHATGRPATAALTGQQTMAGVMGAATRPITAAVTGQQVYSAAMAAEFQKLTAVLTGEQSQAGVLAATQPKLTAALTGSQTQTGVLAAAMKKALFAGSAGHTQSGSLAAAAKKLLAVLAGTGIHPAEDWSSGDTVGTWSWTIPAWCKTGDLLDIIMLGGGRGGDKGATISAKPGGLAGGWWSDTLTIGVDVAVGAILTGSVGAGGAKNSGNGGNTTCTTIGATALGATGNNGSNGSNGNSAGTRTQGTLSVTGGPGGSGSSSGSGGNGGKPGGGGGGGGSLFFIGQNGGAGARGQVNIRARDQYA